MTTHVIYFSASYKDAIEYLGRLRNVEPPIYNQHRLTELPVPSFDNDAINGSADPLATSINEDNDTLNSIEIADTIECHDNTDTVDQINASTDPLATSNIENYDTFNSTGIADALENDDSIDTVIQTNASTDPLESSINEDDDTLSSTDIVAALENDDNISTVRQINASVGPVDASDNESDRTSNSTENSTIASTIGQSEHALDINVHIDGCNGSATNSLATHSANMKIERDCNLVPLYDHHVANRAEIQEILREQQELPHADDNDEDAVIMIVGPSGIPTPMRPIVSDLIKRESDKMSGDIEFKETVSTYNNENSKVFIIVNI